MPTNNERVYQASPGVCAKIARGHLRLAREALASGDSGTARRELDQAAAWLPSWMEDEWDDRMAAWMGRAGVQAGGGDLSEKIAQAIEAQAEFEGVRAQRIIRMCARVAREAHL